LLQWLKVVHAQPQLAPHLGRLSAVAATSAAVEALAAASRASLAALVAASLATVALVLVVFPPLGVGSVLLFFLPGLAADFLVLFLQCSC